MEKKSLKLGEYYNLEAELNGIVNQQTGAKVFSGILAQKLPLNVKYWLTDLAKKVKEQTDACETLRQELVKKYGEDDGNGNIAIKPFLDAENTERNPKLEEYQSEYVSLLNEEREFEYKQLKLSDIGELETEESYPLLFSLLKAE